MNSKIKQEKFGQKSFMIFLAFISAVSPMSTDMYLPALPHMAKYFNTTADIANLTLLCYFFFFALSMLLSGPMSDKHGRKKILIIGSCLYTIASFCSIFSYSIRFLILFRVFQALGAGIMATTATAIVKDAFDGKERESTLAWVQSMIIIGPITAPLIGSFLIQYTNWQGIFLLFTILGLIVINFSLMLTETLPNAARNTGSFCNSLMQLGVVIKNPRFSILLILFSLMALPFFGYISTSSYIYINTFKLNEQQFSYFFSANAFLAMLGPLLYVKASKIFHRNTIITFSFGALLISGILLLFQGHTGPIVFSLSLAPFSILTSLLRPPSTNLLLEQQKHNTGAASSLIGFSAIGTGCIGIGIISLLHMDYIKLISLEVIVAGILSIVIWLSVSSKSFVNID